MAGVSKWRKMKLALGLNTCLYVSESSDGESVKSSSRSCSDARGRLPITPTPSSSGLRVSRYSDKSTSEPICAVCLMPMKATGTDTIFKAECSHSFHYHCIASNVKYGNRACPVCRAKWKEIPLTTSGSCVKSNTNTDDYTMVGMPLEQWNVNRNIPLLFQAFEPLVFDDDERVNQKAEEIDSGDSDFNEGIDIKAYPEVSAVARSACFDNFGILINIKAPIAKSNLNARASIDLVTMLDISVSMTGTKIALLKQAMGFVVQNLGPWDRLSVIAFSSTACRLFPLRRMTETGKRESLQMINSLVAIGGTNIAEALRKGWKVMTDRKSRILSAV